MNPIILNPTSSPTPLVFYLSFLPKNIKPHQFGQILEIEKSVPLPHFALIFSRPAAEILFHGGLVHVVVAFVTRIWSMIINKGLFLNQQQFR